MRLRDRLLPYLLLGVLTLATGVGIGLGLSEAPSTSPTFTIFVPASSGTTSISGYGFLEPMGTTCHVSRHEAGGTLWVQTTAKRVA